MKLWGLGQYLSGRVVCSGGMLACVQIPSTQVKDTYFNDIPRISVLEGVAVAVGRSWSLTGPSRQVKSSKFSERPMSQNCGDGE